MAMKAGNEAMRALAFSAAADIDRAHNGDDSAKKRVELYTPIVKGWMTELAQELTSLNIQVHGGMGFIEETGAAQHYRDARILPIYEGTTGIQALDLIGRKTLFDKGEALKQLHSDIQETISALNASDNQSLSSLTAQLENALNKATEAGNWILDNTAADPRLMGNVSFDNLMMMGYLVGGWLMARSALLASQQDSDNSAYSGAFLEGKIATANFYAEHYLPRVNQHADTVLTGLKSTFSLDIEQLQGA